MDPLGKRWQQKALSRSVLSLDTDAVLFCLVKELPESDALVKCIKSLQQEGVKIVVPSSVLAEVVGHIERAPRTYRRFEVKLFSMPPDAVDGGVWHTVVRGYYYKCVQDATWKSHWRKYYNEYLDKDEPLAFIKQKLGRRITSTEDSTEIIPDEWHADIEEITESALKKERRRPKAKFRDEQQMADRLRRDIRNAMGLAKSIMDGAFEKGRGYLVSEDRAFREFEAHQAWRARPSVHIFTRMLPQLCEIVCGEPIDEGAMLKMFFSPVTRVAAELMKDDIDRLITAGVDLARSSLDRVEWDLKKEINDQVRAWPTDEEEESDEEMLSRLVRLAEVAQAKGYPLTPEMQEIVDNYDNVKAAYLEARDKKKSADIKVAQMEVGVRESMKKVIMATMGATKKGRSRVRRALGNIGYDLDEILGEDTDGDG